MQRCCAATNNLNQIRPKASVLEAGGGRRTVCVRGGGGGKGAAAEGGVSYLQASGSSTAMNHNVEAALIHIWHQV